MTLEADDDILQDFLVEAGEILEQLGEQLVELEQSPQDADLLNAVFRGFHTVKGGAGFLGLTPMVEVCHRAEDVFNVLRQGERHVDTGLMDAVLQVLDIVNEQFNQISSGEEPTAAPDELLKRLEALAVPGGEAPDTGAQANASAATPATGGEGDAADDEFETLLDAAAAGNSQAGTAPPTAAGAGGGGDDISEEEFEQLLDDLHGTGRHSGTPHPHEAPAAAPRGAAASDEITDEEFEQLLDELHGNGQHGGTPAAQPQAAAAAPQPEPAHAAAPKPVEHATASSAPAKHPARPAAEPTVRVDTRRLDDIMNMVGELVLVRNRLSTLKASMENEAVSKAVANLDLVTADLQAAVMKTRMQPIKKVFGRFPRVVRDLARSLKKEVELEMVGEETDLDKNLVEALADPLVHLVRNAVDHGVEAPDVREAAGKPRVGRVVLQAAQEGDHILLTIKDDGAGMDPEVLRRVAVEKGVMDVDSAARLDDKDCYNLIFAPGFSTKAEISDVSGRGVGMDVVKTRIAQLNGTVEIDSQLGKGSRLSIKLPLTLAILPTLMVKVGKRPFAMPLSNVSEIFHLENGRTNVVDGQLCVMVRGKALPLFYLREWLVRNPGDRVESDNDQVIVAHVANQRVGLVVNQVLGQEEVVIKPLGALLHGMAGFAGATITGDGRIALILDLPGLMKAYARRG
ncbi:MAG: chemotaxis protein CheA [Gammaproteobacteria bacterium]